MSKMRIICTFIIILAILPNACMAVEYICIYGVTIHLKDNKKLEGYIETGTELYACNEKEDGSNKVTLKSYLENLKRVDGETQVTSINKLFCIEFKQYYENKYRNIPSYLVTESSYQTVKAADIKSIKGVCRKGDGNCSIWNIPRITNSMAEYISNHTLIAGYYYYDNTPKPEGINDCHLTLLSYNSKYTRKELIKLRKKIRKMPDEVLEKEKLIRVSECAD